MFQYATGRALALRTRSELYVDTKTGFLRDRNYKRTYALCSLPITAPTCGLAGQLPSWFERGHRRFIGGKPALFNERLWGTYVFENERVFIEKIVNLSSRRNLWLDGTWQTERYFEDFSDEVSTELCPAPPRAHHFLNMAEKMRSCRSVAVGVRLYEEVDKLERSGVGGVTPLEFYRFAAQRLPPGSDEREYFVFCTHHSDEIKYLQLPGQTHWITPEEGYGGDVDCLWLMSQCQDYVISNSSYYWWAAWLGERRNRDATVVASTQFINRDSVPNRWKFALREKAGFESSTRPA